MIAITRAVGISLICSLGAIFATSAQAASDLAGVWVVTQYSPQIKTSEGKTPPLLPAAAKVYDKRKALLAKGDDSFDIVAAQCGPPGMPRVMMLPYAFEIAQNQNRVVFMFEWNRMYRRVDIDSPSLAADDLQFSGRSLGRWEGDTLVISVTKIDDTFIDAAGMPHSDALKITEHLRLRDASTLENRMRFEDPKTFSKPWETVVTYRKLPAGVEVGEDICLDRIGNTKAIDNDNYLRYPK